jgi:hypothetical protein
MPASREQGYTVIDVDEADDPAEACAWRCIICPNQS